MFSSYQAGVAARVVAVAVAFAASFLVRAAPNQQVQVMSPCNMDFPSDFPPVDYRSNKVGVQAVEKHHFTPNVENLIRGESDDRIGADIQFMLKRSPNHHRALISLSKLAKRLDSERIPGMEFLTSCYFDRAIFFRRDDTVVRVLYALHLKWLKDVAGATRQLEAASAWAKDNPMSHYSIGLAFLELGDADAARREAVLAYELGAVQPDLRERLRKAGKWDQAAPGTPDKEARTGTPPPSAASSASSVSGSPTPAVTLQ